MKKTRGMFEITYGRVQRPQRIHVYGYQTGLLGLVVTMDYNAAGNNKKSWGFTHVRSGYGFLTGRFTSYRKAIKFAQEHFTACDWNRDKKDVVRDEKIRECITAVIKALNK